MGDRYATKGRFKPKHTTISGQVFDSAFEAAVWKELLKIRSCSLERQFKAQVKKETQRFPAKYWSVDFRIEFSNQAEWNQLLVEAKGALTAEFLNTVVYLEAFSSGAFNDLLLVFPDSFPTNEKGMKVIKKTESYHLKWCCKCDLVDTVKTRLGIIGL